MTSSTGQPVGIGSAEYCAWPSTSFATLFAVDALQEGERALRPRPRTGPCARRRRGRRRVRTAWCSAIRPEYSTGMSQPPKGTIFAPLSRWTAWRGVLRSSDIAGKGTLPHGRERGQ